MSASALTGLQCHLCKANYPAEALWVCEKCLGPLEPVYDYSAVKVTREEIERRPKNLWRYLELLPVEAHGRGRSVCFTVDLGHEPPVRHLRIAERLIQIVHRTDARLERCQPLEPLVARPRGEHALHLLVGRRVTRELLGACGARLHDR